MADEVWTHDESPQKIAESKGLVLKSFTDVEPPPVQRNFPEDES
jgi:hypothetical protein